MEIYGVAGLSVARHQNGVLRVKLRRTAPLESLLEGVDNARVQELRAELKLWPQSLDCFYALPATAQATDWAYRFLQEKAPEWIDTLLDCFSHSVVVSQMNELYPQLERPQLAREQKARLLRHVADQQRPLGEPAGWPAQRAALIQSQGPLCDAERFQAQLRQHMRPATQDGADLVAVPLAQQQGAAHTDLLWPDLSRRLVLGPGRGRGRAGQGGYWSLLIENPHHQQAEIGHRPLVKVEPHRCRFTRHPDQAHLLDQLEQLAAPGWDNSIWVNGNDYRQQLLLSSVRPLSSPCFSSRRLSPLEPVALQYTSDVRLEQASGEQLLQMAQQLNLTPMPEQEEDELRLQVITAAAQAHPPGDLLAGQGALIRKAGATWMGARQIEDWQPLVAAQAHALSGRLLLEGLSANPRRALAESHSLEAYRPANPFR